MNEDWSRSLNHRKQLFWKQVNNAQDAEQYENWLKEDTPILPRKFRIADIRGEPENQKNIRVNVTFERVKRDIKLLRLRSQNNQHKVINADKEMDDDLKRKTSGRTLEILQNMWKTECEKEEKKSLDKWKYKEIWLLDYVMRYGNNATKEKASKQKRETAHKRDEH